MASKSDSPAIRSPRCIWHLSILFLIALIIRIVYNIAFVGIDDTPAGDAWDYHEIAVNFAESGIYSAPSRPPLFPLAMGVVYALFGVNTFLIRIFLSVIGSLTCCVIYFMGREAFGSKIGWYAAWWSVFYFMLFHWNGYILTETPFTFWLCLSVLFMLKSRNIPRIKYWVASGFFMGLAALTRPVMLPFMPVIFLWAYCSFIGNLKRIVIAGLTIVSVMSFVIVPWTIRNYVVYNAFVPVSTMSGTVLLGSNNPNVFDHFQGGWIHPKKSGLIKPGETQGLSPVALDKLYTTRAMQFIMERPLYIAKLALYKFKLFWHLNRAVDPASLQYMIVISLAMLGSLVTIKKWRQSLILYIIPVFYTLIALLFWGNDRIRSPIEPILLLFAGCGFEYIRSTFLRLRLSRRIKK